jgi:hypothetical protein
LLACSQTDRPTRGLQGFGGRYGTALKGFAARLFAQQRARIVADKEVAFISADDHRA